MTVRPRVPPDVSRKHYGLLCRLRRHKRGAPDMKAYALVGVVVDWCDTCSREWRRLNPVDLDALRRRDA